MGDQFAITEELMQYDFRSNLVVDQNNPILIQKAWRDRFSGDSYWKKGKDGGKAYLGVPHGEDAMTWNVFRTLQKEGQLGCQVIAEVLNVSPVEKILFWGCDVDSPGDEQQLLSILIRTVDGRLQGTMTEPDLVLITVNEVAFVECKLNLTGNQSPWRAQPGPEGQKSGSEKRMEKYVDHGFAELREVDNWQETYQLLRQYVYACLLAKHLNKEPAVIPLINQAHLEKLFPIYDRLRSGPLKRSRVFRDMTTWQAFMDSISRSGISQKTMLQEQMLATIAASRKYQKESE